MSMSLGGYLYICYPCFEFGENLYPYPYLNPFKKGKTVKLSLVARNGFCCHCYIFWAVFVVDCFPLDLSKKYAHSPPHAVASRFSLVGVTSSSLFLRHHLSFWLIKWVFINSTPSSFIYLPLFDDVILYVSAYTWNRRWNVWLWRPCSISIYRFLWIMCKWFVFVWNANFHVSDGCECEYVICDVC